MATLPQLLDSLGRLQEGAAELRQLIHQLGNGIPHEKAAHNTTSSSFSDLDAEIADGLHELQDEMELLREDATDLGAYAPVRPAEISSRRQELDRGKEALARLATELEELHAAFRQARLQARRRREAAAKEEHRQMLATYWEEDEDEDEDEEDDHDEEKTDGRPRNGDETLAPGRPPSSASSSHQAHQHHHYRPSSTLLRSPSSASAAAAADVTAALRQTHARIAGEVARSDFAAQTLAESSRALAELGERYHAKGRGDLGGSLLAARSMVRGLVAAHKSDTWYLQTALALLLGTALWLLFRRLLYGPLWLLLWWPLRSTVGTVSAVARLGGVGRGEAQAQAHASLSHLPSVPMPGTALTASASIPTVAAAAVSTASSPASAPPPSHSPLVEKVGRIIDGEPEAQADRNNDTPNDTDAEASANPNVVVGNDTPRNPKKRMWEEDVEAARRQEEAASSVKDEL